MSCANDNGIILIHAGIIPRLHGRSFLHHAWGTPTTVGTLLAASHNRAGTQQAASLRRNETQQSRTSLRYEDRSKEDIHDQEHIARHSYCSWSTGLSIWVWRAYSHAGICRFRKSAR